MTSQVWTSLTFMVLASACGGSALEYGDPSARAASADHSASTSSLTLANTTSELEYEGSHLTTRRVDRIIREGSQLKAHLWGAHELSEGDLDGSGLAVLTLNEDHGEVCFELVVTDIEPATEAHIHEAPDGRNGKVVIGLAAPSGGSSKGCAYFVDKDLINDVRKHPENYYVNVHNAEFPAGALRGQLSK